MEFVSHASLYSTGKCLQWEKRYDIVNKIPADGNFLTAENSVHCANQCSKEVTCMSFFFTGSTMNNCLLKYDVITDDDESELVDVTYSSYFVLKGSERLPNGNDCLILFFFKLISLVILAVNFMV